MDVIEAIWKALQGVWAAGCLYCLYIGLRAGWPSDNERLASIIFGAILWPVRLVYPDSTPKP